MFNNLSHREIFMLMLVGNILVYFLSYQIAVRPVQNMWRDKTEELASVNEELQMAVEEKKEYQENKRSITELKEERQKKYSKAFPYTGIERVHWFIDRQCTYDKDYPQNVLAIDSISINGEKAGNVSEEEGMEEIFRNVNVSLGFNEVDYDKIMYLLRKFEDMNRTLALTSFSMSSGNVGQNVNLQYKLLTVKKEGNKKDPLFDDVGFVVGGGEGSTRLKMKGVLDVYDPLAGQQPVAAPPVVEEPIAEEPPIEEPAAVEPEVEEAPAE